MWTGLKPILKLGIVSVAILHFGGCQGDLTTSVAGAPVDSIGVDHRVHASATPPSSIDDTPKGHLTKRLRTPVVLSVDTLHPISKDSLQVLVRLERQRIQDSVKQALDKRPKHIYLTFDDGPLMGSQAIDSIVRSKNVKISAFLVGKHANMSKRLRHYLELYQVNKWVECYNHSYTHAENRFTSFYSNPVSAYEDFERNELDLKLKHKIVRLPGRNIWIYDDVRRIDLKSGASTADLLYTNDYKIFGWDIEWKIVPESGKPVQSIEEIYTRIKNYMDNKSSMEPNNVVLLMHDGMFRNKEGQKLLSSLIDTIQTTMDYRFEFMSDYPFRY